MVENAPISDDHPSPTDPARAAERARDAAWVQAAVSGDPEAFGRLYDAWFDRVFHLALRIVHDRDTAQEVGQDAFLSAWRGLAGLEDPGAFGGWLLRIARNAALNRSAREERSRPVDDQALTVIEGTNASPISAPAGFGAESRLARADDPDAAVADGEIATLVRETVAALGDRDAEVLDLQLRFDLTPADIGEVIGLNRNAANQLCHRVRGRFATAFGARMLWAGSRPACSELARVLTSAGVEAFGPDAVALADEHAARCEVCDERRRTRVQPSALFAAVPVLAAPAPVKAQVAAELAGHGVPMSGSASLRASDAGTTSSSPADGGPEPPAPPDPPASDAGATVRSTAHRAVIGAVVVVGSALLAAFLLTRSGSGDDGLVATNAADGATTTTAGSSARVGGDDPATGAADPGAKPPATSAPDPTPPTPAVPAPQVELFELAPFDPQPTTYTLGPGSPTLRWSVTGATDVQVWMWFDDGASPPAPPSLVSTDLSGALDVCPGTRLSLTSCETAAGTYAFGVEAANQHGVTVATDPSSRPSFEVYIVIL